MTVRAGPDLAKSAEPRAEELPEEAAPLGWQTLAVRHHAVVSSRGAHGADHRDGFGLGGAAGRVEPGAASEDDWRRPAALQALQVDVGDSRCHENPRSQPAFAVARIAHAVSSEVAQKLATDTDFYRRRAMVSAKCGEQRAILI